MNTTPSYKYLVAEDEPIIRKNIIKKINALELPFTLCAEVNDGIQAISALDQMLPQLVLTDICMPRCDGLSLARYIKDNHPSMKTIILSGYHDFSYAQAALRHNVCEYLLKPIKIDALRETLERILLSLDSERHEMQSFHVSAHDITPEKLCGLMLHYFQNNYKKEISLSHLADQLGFSMEYLARIFKKEMGMSPSKYLIHLRINEAKQLLLSHPSLEVGKIGELVGYRDSYYFSRIFKNNVSMAPSEYRHKNRDVAVES